MDWESAVLLRAITEWRDRYRLSIAARLNDVAIAALASFESLLASAAWREMLLDQETLAAFHIDSEMRPPTESVVAETLDAASRALRLIDARFEDIALALPQAGWPVMPRLHQSAATAKGARWQISTIKVPDSLRAWQPAEIGLAAVRRAVQATHNALDASDARLRDWTGTHRRVRDKARDHVKDVWLGQDGKARTVLTQIEDTFDRSAEQAREILL